MDGTFLRREKLYTIENVFTPAAKTLPNINKNCHGIRLWADLMFYVLQVRFTYTLVSFATQFMIPSMVVGLGYYK
jgi:hypothetical protein